MHALTRRQFGALMLSSAACAALGLSGCTGNQSTSAPAGSAAAGGVVAADANTLRVGCRADVVGFGYLNEKTNKFYGLEIDIANELAKRLGKKRVTFTITLPENRKELLLDGDIDCLIACYSIADTRKKNFDFSPAYYDDSIIAVVQNTSMFESIDQMVGCTFGTMNGANAAPLLANKFEEMGFSAGVEEMLGSEHKDVRFDTWNLKQFDSYQELSDALEEGIVDAMVLDGAIAKTYMDDKRHILEDFVVDTIQYGVATPKDGELSEPVAAAIQEMLDDGTIESLTDKWN